MGWNLIKSIQEKTNSWLILSFGENLNLRNYVRTLLDWVKGNV